MSNSWTLKGMKGCRAKVFSMQKWITFLGGSDINTSNSSQSSWADGHKEFCTGRIPLTKPPTFCLPWFHLLPVLLHCSWSFLIFLFLSLSFSNRARALQLEGNYYNDAWAMHTAWPPPAEKIRENCTKVCKVLMGSHLHTPLQLICCIQ